jgi:hypothetical protein
VDANRWSINDGVFHGKLLDISTGGIVYNSASKCNKLFMIHGILLEIQVLVNK